MSRTKNTDSRQAEQENPGQTNPEDDGVTVAHTLEADETRTVEQPTSGVLVADEEGKTEVQPEEEGEKKEPPSTDLGVQASSEQISTVLTSGLQTGGAVGGDAVALGDLAAARQSALGAATRATEFKGNQGKDTGPIADATAKLSEAFSALEEAVRGE